MESKEINLSLFCGGCGHMQIAAAEETDVRADTKVIYKVVCVAGAIGVGCCRRCSSLGLIITDQVNEDSSGMHQCHPYGSTDVFFVGLQWEALNRLKWLWEKTQSRQSPMLSLFLLISVHFHVGANFFSSSERQRQGKLSFFSDITAWWPSANGDWIAFVFTPPLPFSRLFDCDRKNSLESPPLFPPIPVLGDI